MSQLKSPSTNPAILPDPRYNGSTIRKAFLVEAIANLFTVPLITNTSWVLNFILKRPTDINPSSILFARLFGGIVVGGLTSALLAGCSNTRNGIESRRIVYLLLGAGEVVMLPILMNELMKSDGKDSAVTKLVTGSMIGLLLPPLMWRMYVLVLRPDLLGRYTEESVSRGEKEL